MNDALDAGARAAIERAVAAVADPSDDEQIAAAVRSISPALVDDVVFGVASSSAGATADGRLLGVGIAASPGVGVGAVVTSSLAALDRWEAGVEVVLVVDATSPADEPAMRIASAIVTRGGGEASHAAIIARQWGVPAVCGLGDLSVGEGDVLLVDGSTGEVRALDDGDADGPDGSPGAAAHHGPNAELPDAVVTLLEWADRLAAPKVAVWANADLAADAQVAFDLGAAGIGLVRTEHQFLGERAPLVARLLGSEGEAHGDAHGDAVVELAALQRTDLVALFEVAAGRPVTIRLLDAPSHEFAAADAPAERESLLGVRGVRLGLLHPAVVEAQVEAIAHAMCDVAEREGELPDARLLVPMVSLAEEVSALRPVVGDVLFRVGVERGRELTVPFGVMVETPRAALCASALAAQCDLFSFGTNDLTQLTYGMSRDDADGTLLRRYRELGLIDRSPFETLDGSAVVRLLALACETGRARRPDLGLGLCGEHGGDPASIAVAVQLGIDTVSVSPYRVPAARLAAAHAVLGPAPTGGT